MDYINCWYSNNMETFLVNQGYVLGMINMELTSWLVSIEFGKSHIYYTKIFISSNLYFNDNWIKIPVTTYELDGSVDNITKTFNVYSSAESRLT